LFKLSGNKSIRKLPEIVAYYKPHSEKDINIKRLLSQYGNDLIEHLSLII
jgi:hypothetical protein